MNHIKSYLWSLILIVFLSGCGQNGSTNTSNLAPFFPEPSPTIAIPTQKPQQDGLPGDASCKKIVFVLISGENSDIFSTCSNGSNLTKLTNSTSINTTPAWSPDGKNIAFSSTRTGGNNQIFVMNVDGSNAIQLTEQCA